LEINKLLLLHLVGFLYYFTYKCYVVYNRPNFAVAGMLL